MKAEDTVMSNHKCYSMTFLPAKRLYISGRDRYDKHVEEAGVDVGCKAVANKQAQISFEAGIKEVVDYFFYEAGIVALMGCTTMEECKARLPKWQAKLKEWEIPTNRLNEEG